MVDWIHYVYLFICVCTVRGVKFNLVCKIFKGKRAVAILLCARRVSFAGLINLSA